jgi:hypothetical protein
MADLVYILCAFMSLACAVLLWKGYQSSGVRLLFWSGLCFSFLAINNILLVIDLTILTEVDLSILRAIPALCGLAVLLFGFIWDERTRT